MVLDPNMGGDQRKSMPAMQELLDQLDQLVGHSQEQTQSYRGVLRSLDNASLSWEQPQDKDDRPMEAPSTHLSKFSMLVNSLRDSVNKNSEILENLNRLI